MTSHLYLLKKVLTESNKKSIRSYKDVGVDVEKIKASQGRIGELVSASHSFPTSAKVLSGFGHYAGLVDIGSKILALHSDGVGTKVMVAQLMDRFDTVGIDCVAMNANDVICVGATPVAFIDYISLRTPNDALIEQLMSGLVEGARQSGVAIVGGETAVLPEIIHSQYSDDKAFDLAGMVAGIVEKQDHSLPILGDRIQDGDVILGVESSGLHSNGYTLARRVLLSKYTVDETAEYLAQTVGEEMLVPTRIYVKPVLELLQRKVDVHGLAHITGGSFTKLPRLNKKVTFILDRLPVSQGIFKQIQVDGNISTKEMYRTFNMGTGFCVIASAGNKDKIIDVFAKFKMHCFQMGRIEKRARPSQPAVVAKLDGKNEVLM